MIRIIAGQWRGRRLKVPHQQGLRPTTDRVKETVFNWLMHDVREANCLDMFAGTGSLGLEALSRGAAHCTFMEQSREAAKLLKANIVMLAAPANVITGDAIAALEQCNERFHLVFLDPPFHQNLLAPAIDVLLSKSLLAENACIYIEKAQDEPLPPLPAHWQLRKQKQHGQVSSLLFDVCASSDV